MSKKKEVTIEDLHSELTKYKQACLELEEERDGLIMRNQAYEAKINGLTRNLEGMQKNERIVIAQAYAAEQLTMKTLSMTIDKAFKMGVKSTETTEGKTE